MEFKFEMKGWEELLNEWYKKYKIYSFTLKRDVIDSYPFRITFRSEKGENLLEFTKYLDSLFLSKTIKRHEKEKNNYKRYGLFMRINI